MTTNFDPVSFEFATATRIIFGPGKIRELGSLAAAFGTRALVVDGIGGGPIMPLLENLSESGVDYVTFRVQGEPEVGTVREGATKAKDTGCDLVIGFGGGSAVDTAKAIAALVTNPGDPLNYLEVIGDGKKLEKAPLPFIAVPTTAGTGAEVTRNAVLASPEHKVKVSLRSPLMLAKIALIDPELTHSVPRAVTASTGLDALTQVMEPYVSKSANPLTDALCLEGMRRAARSLRRVYHNGKDAEARQDMAVVSLFGGLALANAKLGAVHGFAGPLGGMFHAPHGAVCAALLPHVMAINVQALRQREPESIKLARYDEIAQIVTGNPSATAADGVTWISELAQELQVPSLASYGVTREHFPILINKGGAASSMKGNPLQLTHDELQEILTRAL